MQEIFESLEISDELKQELNEKFQEKINEAAEEKAQTLFESKKNEFIIETAEKLDDYLSIIAEEYARELEEVRINEEKIKKAEAIVEGVGAVLTAAGIDIASIVKIVNEDLDESSLTESDDRVFEYKKQLDETVNEKIELERERQKMIKAGLLYETAVDENLSVMQVEKLKELVQNLDENLSLEEYNEALEKLIETIDYSSYEYSNKKNKTLKESYKESSFIPSHLI